MNIKKIISVIFLLILIYIIYYSQDIISYYGSLLFKIIAYIIGLFIIIFPRNNDNIFNYILR